MELIENPLLYGYDHEIAPIIWTRIMGAVMSVLIIGQFFLYNLVVAERVNSR